MKRMRRSFPILLALALLALLAPLALGASEPVPPLEEDPWTGKTRAEILHLLGEPAKAKTARGGEGETLTYRFYRVDPDAPPPEAVLVQVPGVGLLARIDKDRLGRSDPMSIEPIGFDNEGRPTGGRVPPGTTASTSYDTDTGEKRRAWSEPDNPPVRGKVTVRFDLDANGVVTHWTAPGRKK